VERLFRAHFVGLSEGGYFGVKGEGTDHMRLNFGCPGWRLEEGLKRIETAVASVPKPQLQPHA
jgi:cystathionine beta-lyase